MIAILNKLRRLLRGSHRLVAMSVGISVVQSLLLVPIAFLIRHAFDVAIPEADATALAWMGLAALALFTAGSGLGLLTRWLSLRATKEAVMRLQMLVLEKLFRLPKAFFDRSDDGRTHATVVQDSLRVDAMVNAVVTVLIPGAVIGVALTATLFVLSPLLGGLLVVAAPTLMVAGRRLHPTVRARSRVWYDAFDLFSARLQTDLRAMTLTRLHGAEDLQLERRRADLASIRDKGVTMSWWQSFYALLQTLISAAIGLLVLVVGGAAVADGRISLGDLVSFYAVLGLLRTQLAGSLFAVPTVIAGAESLDELEKLIELNEPDPYRGTSQIDFQGRIALREVAFSYRPDTPLLRGVDLEIEPGELVVIVGANGSGKSTIISLLAGLYRPARGRVEADGVPLDELDLTKLRRSMGIVVQDPFIFPGTVRENIAFGRRGAEGAMVERAAERACAHEFIAELPGRYDARVGDEGELLSGGQRQRLAIARALLAEPRLLMLDEPTTHLDHGGVRELMASLAELAPRPSVVVVTHDPEVAREADRVVRLRDGRVKPAEAQAAASGR